MTQNTTKFEKWMDKEHILYVKVSKDTYYVENPKTKTFMCLTVQTNCGRRR